MRLWSVHPRYLDAKGLVACWREGLLARAVLRGETRGYTHHPQLVRFRSRANAVAVLDVFLSRVLDEARTRGYQFDADKIDYREKNGRRIAVTDTQLRYEWRHLLRKLRVRDPARHRALRKVEPSPHPLFVVVQGPIASWERSTG